MRGLFSVEGKFYTVTSKIVDMVFLTILWGIGCIPIVTILTSTASLYQATVKCIRYDRGKVLEEFKDAYWKNLKQGIGLTLILGAVGVVMVPGDYYVFCKMPDRSGLALALVIGMVIWSMLYLMNVVWMIPLFSRFSNTTGRLLRFNYVVAARCMARSILMVLILAMGVILAFVSLPLVLILPSLAMLAMSYLAEPVLGMYMPEQEENA